MRYGELFAGAGGMSLGLDRAGMEPVFHAEIADLPRRVLTRHWPTVPLYGDVSTLDGRSLVESHGPIDLLAGGSPCQDLSVAGKRAGLDGARSGLFHEQIRLWEETGATYLLWENVAGALSSNRGADFARVLSAVVGGDVAVPPKGWRRSGGVVAGPRGVAAWRCLDAQYFGVPQRRLRVFVLGARAGGVDPAEVLLEPEGVRRNPPTRREAGEGAAASAGDGTPDKGGVVGYTVTNSSNRAGWFTGDKVGTLCAGGNHEGASLQHGVLAFKPGQSEAAGATFVTEDFAPTLQAQNNGSTAVPAVLAFHLDLSYQRPLPGEKKEAYWKRMDEYEKAHGITPAMLAGQVAYFDKQRLGALEVVDSLLASMHKGPGHNRDGHVVLGTLNGTQRQQVDGAMVAQHGIPRRLMPVECERLMGWPDGWTDVPDEKGKPASDAVRYKACGNGVVSHVAEWIASRLIALEEAASIPAVDIAA